MVPMVEQETVVGAIITAEVTAEVAVANSADLAVAVVTPEAAQLVNGVHTLLMVVAVVLTM